MKKLFLVAMLAVFAVSCERVGTTLETTKPENHAKPGESTEPTTHSAPPEEVDPKDITPPRR